MYVVKMYVLKCMCQNVCVKMYVLKCKRIRKIQFFLLLFVVDINNMNSVKGICCPEHLVKGEHNIDQRLFCQICYQVMTEPVQLKCGYNHTFGHSCISEWFEKGKNNCPICRNHVEKLEPHPLLTHQVPQLRAVCPHCEEWEGNMGKVMHHEQNCESYYQMICRELEKVVKDQLHILNKDINPHLQLEHGQIFEKYVQDWFWLYSDDRNWKWWWWANNPWWNNTPCKPCNNLWHKHEKEMDRLEEKRIYLIRKLNNEFSLYGIRSLFDN